MTVALHPDILRWSPIRWDDFLGNKKIIKHFKRLVRRLRQQMDRGEKPDLNRLCFLLTGLSRTGKTALVKFLVRCLGCRDLNLETLNPCNFTCWTCSQRPDRFCVAGLFQSCGPYDPTTEGRVLAQLFPIDCTDIYTPAELREQIENVEEVEYSNDVSVVFLDEVHRLVKRSMDEILLKKIEEVPAIWIFATAKPGELEDMLLNRLLKFSTERPSTQEMGNWLCDRCDEWEIKWEAAAVLRVVEKSNRVVGTALHALALASLDPDVGLTLDLVENDWDTALPT